MGDDGRPWPANALRLAREVRARQVYCSAGGIAGHILRKLRGRPEMASSILARVQIVNSIVTWVADDTVRQRPSARRDRPASRTLANKRGKSSERTAQRAQILAEARPAAIRNKASYNSAIVKRTRTGLSKTHIHI
jgi:hypothetical protein